MKQDINFPTIEGVKVAIIRKNIDPNEWVVYLLNENDFPLNNVLIASCGYGESNGEKIATSTLRHSFEQVAAHSHVAIETIDESVFHLTNEYWISYRAKTSTEIVAEQLFDKLFIFLPNSITETNFIVVSGLNKEGILST